MNGMDLIEWLRAQLDEDERVALAARPGFFTAEHFANAAGLSPFGYTELRHVITFTPGRMLAEVKAKRAILDALSVHLPDEVTSGAALASTVLGILDQAYAGRGGWQPEGSVTP